MMNNKITDFSYPLPPHKLHNRYDSLFQGFKLGLSSTLVGLSQSHRSSFLKFILYQDENFLNEFIDTKIYKFILIEEPINNSLDFVRTTIFKLSGLGIFSQENLQKMEQCLKSGDSLLCLLTLEQVLSTVVGKYKIVLVLYEAEKILSSGPEIVSIVTKIWAMFRKVPNPLISLCFIISPVFLEKINEVSLLTLKPAFEENICYFPLFDKEEMEYSWKRNQKILNIEIPLETHILASKLSGGHPVLYRSLIYLDKQKIFSLQDKRGDPSIDNLLKFIWEGIPTVARINWSYDLLKDYKPIVKLGFINEGKLILPLFPPQSSKNEIDEKFGEIPQLSAKQKLIFDFFILNENRVVSREEIAQVMWGKLWQEKYSDWAIDKSMSDLKKKLIQTGKTIITLRNRGYKYART